MFLGLKRFFDLGYTKNTFDAVRGYFRGLRSFHVLFTFCSRFVPRPCCNRRLYRHNFRL